jgi:hypothetical protein
MKTALQKRRPVFRTEEALEWLACLVDLLQVEAVLPVSAVAVAVDAPPPVPGLHGLQRHLVEHGIELGHVL